MSRVMTSAVGLLLAATFAAPAVVRADCGKDPKVVEKAGLARDLVGQKKYAEAEGPAGEALSACPSSDAAAAALGEALFAQNKHDALVDRMSGALGKSATTAYAYYWRGKAYNAKKQQARMVDDFEAFLKLAPTAPEAAAVKQLLAGLR
jgi:hypothetical protein